MTVAELVAELSKYDSSASVEIMIPGDESVGIWPITVAINRVFPDYYYNEDGSNLLCGVIIEGEV